MSTVLRPLLQEPDALDQDGKQRNPHCLTRQCFLPGIPRLQPLRVPRSDSLQAAVCESADWLRHSKEHEIVPIRKASATRRANLRKHLSESGSGIVPIQKARMQWQEPHPLGQHCNQGIFTRRWDLQDIPNLQPMRVALADTGAEHNIISHSYARLRSLGLHPNRGLRITRTLRCHESHRLKQIRFCYGYYSAHVLQSLDSGAVPTYDARQSRKRLLNALRRQDDNSQCSELREWERHNWYFFSMALVIMGMNIRDSPLRDQIETYFQEYFLSAFSGVTEGGFFVGRFGHVRRYGSSVGSQIGATRLAISRVGEDVL